MAQQLAREFDHFAEVVVPALVQLIPNTAKIMATSGTIALRFIVQVQISNALAVLKSFMGVCFCVCVLELIFWFYRTF